MVDPTNTSYYPKTDSKAPTSSEIYGLRVAQKALKLDPGLDLKGKTVTELLNMIKAKGATLKDANDKAPADSNKKLTPIVSLLSLMTDT